MVSATKLVDGARDYKLLSRAAVNALVSMPEVNRFSKGLYEWIGFRTKWIQYENVERVAGETKWSFWKLFKYAMEGIFAFTTAPLRIATVLGLITSLLSIIYLFVVVVQKLAFGIDVAGYATIVTLILLLGGIQLSCIGIIGEYVARTYIQTKGRTIYIAKEVIKNRKYDK